MGEHRVSSHTRRTSSGKIVRVDRYQRSKLDGVRLGRRTAIEERRKERRQPWFEPRRAGRRLRRAWDAAQKRKKTTAAILVLGGVAEIVGFFAARGVGAVVLAVAIALTATAGALLAASGGTAAASAECEESEVRERFAPRGARAEPLGRRPRPGRAAPGKRAAPRQAPDGIADREDE